MRQRLDDTNRIYICFIFPNCKQVTQKLCSKYTSIVYFYYSTPPFNQGIGLMDLPLTYKPQWRCGPVEAPVAPILPIN